MAGSNWGDNKKIWNEERTAILKRMWIDEDKSAKEIAEAMGGGVTRNAVIGAANRLGLKKGCLVKKEVPPKPQKPKTKIRERYVEKVVQPIVATPCEPPQVDDVNIPVTERVKLVDLRASHCRFPIGDPRHDEDFGFCGRQKESVTDAYCREHAELCYAGKGRALTDSERRLIAAAKRVTYA